MNWWWLRAATGSVSLFPTKLHKLFQTKKHSKDEIDFSKCRTPAGRTPTRTRWTRTWISSRNPSSRRWADRKRRTRTTSLRRRPSPCRRRKCPPRSSRRQQPVQPAGGPAATPSYPSGRKRASARGRLGVSRAPSLAHGLGVPNPRPCKDATAERAGHHSVLSHHGNA